MSSTTYYVCVLFLIFLSCSFIHAADWDYNSRGQNASHWAKYFPECGGSRQSPIDIPYDPSQVAQCNSALSLDWQSETTHFAVTNVGHTLMVVPFDISHDGALSMTHLEVLHHTNDTNIRLKNPFFHTYHSNIHKEYCFHSMHFHWGANDDIGSEHAVNGERLPLELHMVHYACDYYVIEDAFDKYTSGELDSEDDQNVLAVIGVMFQIGEANPILQKILDDSILNNIAEFTPQATLEEQMIQLFYTEFNPSQLMSNESRDFIAYEGSLTTPGCQEIVRWNVMTTPMTVSSEQMMRFRKLLKSDNSSHTMSDNWRPLQPLKNRTIYTCSEHIEQLQVKKDKNGKDDIHKNGKTWDYDAKNSNVSSWKYQYPLCDISYNHEQSPIDIPWTDMLQCQQDLQLQWTASNTMQFGLRNNGYTLQAMPFRVSYKDIVAVSNVDVLHHTNDTNIKLMNSVYNTYKSPIHAEYCLESINFHWGHHNNEGSEHTLDGQPLPLELHIVHFACEYGSMDAAIEAYQSGQLDSYDDQHVVSIVAILFEIGQANPALDVILNEKVISSKGVQYFDDDILQLVYVEFDPNDLLPPQGMRTFVEYAGSLTSPPCWPIVQWNVLTQTMTVSETQMMYLRSIMENSNGKNRDYLQPNFRPVQPIGDRPLYKCVETLEQDYTVKDVTMESDADADADVILENQNANANENNNSNTSLWFVIAITSICLLAITGTTSVYFAYVLYCKKKPKKLQKHSKKNYSSVRSNDDWTRASATDLKAMKETSFEQAQECTSLAVGPYH